MDQPRLLLERERHEAEMDRAQQSRKQARAKDQHPALPADFVDQAGDARHLGVEGVGRQIKHGELDRDRRTDIFRLDLASLIAHAPFEPALGYPLGLGVAGFRGG